MPRTYKKERGIMKYKRGFLPIDREELESKDWLSQKFTKSQAKIDLKGMAFYFDKVIDFRGERIEIPRAHLLTSIRKLTIRWKWNRRTVTRFLNDLEENKSAIVQTKTYRYTIIEVKNYQLNNSAPLNSKKCTTEISSLKETNLEQEKSKVHHTKQKSAPLTFHSKKNIKNKPPIVPHEFKKKSGGNFEKKYSEETNQHWFCQLSKETKDRFLNIKKLYVGVRLEKGKIKNNQFAYESSLTDKLKTFFYQGPDAIEVFLKSLEVEVSHWKKIKKTKSESEHIQQIWVENTIGGADMIMNSRDPENDPRFLIKVEYGKMKYYLNDTKKEPEVQEFPDKRALVNAS